MKARHLVLVVVALILALLCLTYFAMAPGGPGDGGRDARDETAATDREADPERTATRKKTPSVPWAEKGVGNLVGKVVEYGTGRPVAGVELELEAGLPGPNRLHTTSTGADGSFRFEAVTNYDDWTLRLTPKAPLKKRKLTDVVVVEDKDNDLGQIDLDPDYSVPGIVIDERGDPVAGVELRAIRGTTQEERMDVLRVIREVAHPSVAVDAATSDGDGRFVFHRLVPGSYDMELTATGFEFVVERDVIVTQTAESRELRFLLPAGFELHGRVIRTDGGPVEGLPVIAFEEPGDNLTDLRLDRRFASTDAKGEFVVEGLGSGQYLLAVAPKGKPYALVADIHMPGRDFVEVVIGGNAWLEGIITGDDGKPVAGAEVYLLDGLMRNAAPTIGKAISDGDGKYRIDGLKSGPVQLIMVNAEGYGPHPPNFLSRLMGRGSSSVTLAEGPNRHDISLGKGAVLRGQVVDREDEEPIAGVKLSLRSPRSFFGGTPTTKSDEEGRFVFTDLPQGTMVLVAEKDGWYQPGVSPQTFAMAAMREAGGSRARDTGRGAIIAVGEVGQELEREVQLAPGSTVRGVVLSPDGQPVAGARVVSEFEQDEGFLSDITKLFPEPAPALADQEGKFSFPGPPPGQGVQIVVNAAGYLEGKSEVLKLRAGEIREGLEVRLRRGATITGKVTDAAGKALAGAQVRYVIGNDNEWSLSWKLRRAVPATTLEDGTYRLTNVETGDLVVQVTHPKYLSNSSRSVTATEGATVTVDAKLESAAKLEGRVVRSDGSPAGGAELDVSLIGGRADGVDSLHRNPRDPVTDSKGAFLMEGVMPGRYRILAKAEGAAPSEPLETQTGAGPVTLTLKPAFVISGLVRGPQGRTIAGMDVAVLQADGDNPRTVASERTDNDGAFEIRDVPAGTYDLRVNQGFNLTGSAPNVISVTIRGVEAGTRGLMIEMEAGLGIAGTVLDQDGKALATGFVWVQAIRPQDAQADWQGVGGNSGVADGAFEVSGLLPGDYEVFTWVNGRTFPSRRATAGGDDVTIDLSAGGVVRGRVLRPDGSLAVGADVTLSSSGRGFAGSGRSDDDGAFEIKGVPAGTYNLDARLADPGAANLSASLSVEVTDGDTSQITISLQKVEQQ